MALKYYSIVLLALLANCGLSSCRGVERPIDINNIDSLLNNPNVRSSILNSVLRSQGSSLERIHDIIISSNGDLNQAVNGINSELNGNILNINGDSVTVNSDALRDILRNAVQSSVRSKLANAPQFASALESSIDQQISAGSDQFNAAVAQSAIPVAAAQQALIVARRKRSLEPKILGIDVGQIVSDLVLGVVRDQLGPVISGLLTTVKETLNGLLIVVGTGDPILDFLSGILNFVLKGLIQVITSIEQTLVPAPASASTETQARRKRDVEVNSLAEVVDGGSSNNGGLLEGIVGPVIAFLANLLTPVNSFLKGLVGTVAGTLQSILGNSLVQPLVNVINAIIDLLIPANQA